MSLANLSSPSFTGAELSDRVNATLTEARAARRFPSVAALLADASLTYETGGRPIVDGDRIRTEDGHAYDVVAATATNHHVATAGGVRLRALPSAGVLTPRQFGAKVDKTTDDTAAVQACATACAETGHEFRLDRGATRVTSTIRFGLSVITDWPAVVNRTDGVDWVTIDNTTNVNANKASYRACNVSAESGAVLVADFLPASPTPVMEYNLVRERGEGVARDLVIAIPSMVAVDGRLTHAAVNIPPANNLIGFAHAFRGLRVIENISGYGLGKGVVVCLASYWCDVRSCKAWACGDAFHLCGHNAASATMLEAWYSNRGVIADGDSLTLQINTQQVREDITLLRGDGITILPGYLEDGWPSNDPGDGAGKYAVTIGTTSGSANRVVGLVAQNLRVGARRAGKRAFRIWGLSNGNLIACREYGGGVDADNVSRALLTNTDFALSSQLPIERFGRVTAGRLEGPFSFPNSGGLLRFQKLLRVGTFDWGSIPAGGSASRDLTIADVGTNWGWANVNVTQVSGGSSLILVRGLMLSRTQVRIIVSNPTAAAIPVSVSLDVKIELGDIGELVTPV